MQVGDDRSRQQLLVTADSHVPRFYSHVVIVDELEDETAFRADLTKKNTTKIINKMYIFNYLC